MDELIVVGICLLLNALLAAYEMAFVSVPRSQLRVLSKTGNQHAKQLIHLRENPERTLSIIQIGITLVGAIAAAVGGAGAGETLEPYLIQTFHFSERMAETISLVVVVVPITYLSVVIGELVPKTLALRNPTKVVLSGAKVLFVTDRIFSPIITCLEMSTHAILKIFFPRSKKEVQVDNPTIELNEFSPLHQKFMLNMADIEKKQIKDILIPWAQVMVINVLSSVEEVFQTVIQSGHTRLPVQFNDSVAGILHTKEFIALKESGEKEWQRIVRQPLVVKEADSALGTMRLMQEKKTHMAIVTIPSGAVSGIVTLEDIIEEVVGDIFDEDDDGRIRKIYAAKIKSRVIPPERK